MNGDRPHIPLDPYTNSVAHALMFHRTHRAPKTKGHTTGFGEAKRRVICPQPLKQVGTLEHPGTAKGWVLGGRARCFMRINRTTDEWHNWCIARNQIDDELKTFYRACTSGELPPQLLTLSKKLDEELLKKQER